MGNLGKILLYLYFDVVWFPVWFYMLQNCEDSTLSDIHR